MMMAAPEWATVMFYSHTKRRHTFFRSVAEAVEHAQHNGLNVGMYRVCGSQGRWGVWRNASDFLVKYDPIP